MLNLLTKTCWNPLCELIFHPTGILVDKIYLKSVWIFTKYNFQQNVKILQNLIFKYYSALF